MNLFQPEALARSGCCDRDPGKANPHRGYDIPETFAQVVKIHPHYSEP